MKQNEYIYSTKTSNSMTETEPMSNSNHQLRMLYDLLGKRDPIRIRAIYKGKAARKLGDNIQSASTLNSDGYGIYFVVNDGGEKDSDITMAVALFVEFDDRDEAEQIEFWKDTGLPEPTVQVKTGNKSIHTYWRINPSTDLEHWRLVQTSLTKWLGADEACTNPSRAMRAPGFKHQKTGKDSEIINQTGTQYDIKQIESAIPEKHLLTRIRQQSGDEWEDAIPCPICGRDTVDCRMHISGEFVQCHRGVRFFPPKLKLSETIRDPQGRQWAYVGDSTNAIGACAQFKIDQNKKITSSHNVQKPQSIAKQLAEARPKEWIIDGLLAVGGFVSIGAETGAGKSVLLYRLAASIASGDAFAGEFEVKKSGKVLILQADESPGDVNKKFQLMDLQSETLDKIDIQYLEAGRLGQQDGVRLVEDLLKNGHYQAVLMDSVTTLFAGNGVSIKDAEFGMFLYEFSKLFDRLKVGAFIADHLRKADIGGRSEVTLDCMRDSNMKNAGVTDVLGYWINNEGQRIMRVLGKRNLTKDTTYTFTGSEEDLSLQLLESSTEILPQQAKAGSERIRTLLASEQRGLDAEEIAKHTCLNERHAQRLLLDLYSQSIIKRKPQSAIHGGRPKFIYFHPEVFVYDGSTPKGQKSPPIQQAVAPILVSPLEVNEEDVPSWEELMRELDTDAGPASWDDLI